LIGYVESRVLRREDSYEGVTDSGTGGCQYVMLQMNRAHVIINGNRNDTSLHYHRDE